MLPTTKSVEKEESVLESTEFDLINLKLDPEPRYYDVCLNGTNTGYPTNDTSENSIPKRIKPEIDTVEYEIKNYVNEIGVYVNQTENYGEMINSVRPSSLKFNDSGISDIGSSANSVASTPEIEQNNAVINEQQASINQKSSGNQKSKRKNRKSRNRANSVNKQKEVATDVMAIIHQDLANRQNMKEQFQKFDLNSILSTGLDKIDFEQKIDYQDFNSEQTIEQKYQSKSPDTQQKAAADCKNTSQQTSDINCTAQPNILFDLPLLSIPDENSDEEVDEELEKFKMYCQETNKLFILNDSKIVIEWEKVWLSMTFIKTNERSAEATKKIDRVKMKEFEKNVFKKRLKTWKTWK